LLEPSNGAIVEQFSNKLETRYMAKGLDINALYIALDATRISRGQSWYAVSKELGIPRSTFTRAKKGLKPDADALTKLLVWSGADIIRLQASK
jgi:hypothetical protein